MRTGAASNKQLVQVSLIFSAFSVSFLEILCVFKECSTLAKMCILLWITTEKEYKIKCLNCFLTIHSL